MKKNFFCIYYHKGFSLAEALITLLIVSLLTLAAMPVITKKKKESVGRGKLMCTINTNGKHVMYDSLSGGNPNNPSTWRETNQKCKMEDGTERDCCIFNIPGNARNFAMTAIGGGGGGAASSKTLKYWIGNGDVNIDGNYGYYRVAAIGSGGAGGVDLSNYTYYLQQGYNFHLARYADGRFGYAGGGGMAAIGTAEYNIDENTTKISMKKGNSVSVKVIDFGFGQSPSGEDSYITRYYTDSTGKLAQEDIIRASGGEGGYSYCGGPDIVPHCILAQDVSVSIHHDGEGGAKGFIYYNGNNNLYKSKATYASYSNSKSGCSSYSGRLLSDESVGFTRGKNSVCFGYSKNYYYRINNFLNYNSNSSSGNFVNFLGQEPSDKEKLLGRGGNTGLKHTLGLDEVYAEAYGYYIGNNNNMRDDVTRITQSGDGFVAMSTMIHSTGGGGKAPVQFLDQQFTPTFKQRRLKIVIGEGGKGGYNTRYAFEEENTDANGSDGGATLIDNMYRLPGGKGGKTGYKKTAMKDTAGEDGEKTPLFYGKNEPLPAYGGLSGTNTGINGLSGMAYGAGGGGGGLSKDGDGNETGKGGNGSPGIVILEW